MDKCVVEYRAKGLFKSAVAVGAGLVVGQYLGGYMKVVIKAFVLKLTDKKPEADAENKTE